MSDIFLKSLDSQHLSPIGDRNPVFESLQFGLSMCVKMVSV